MTIRTRILLIIVPVLIAALLISGVVSSLSARSGLMRVSMKLMSFKAEELQKYIDNQWHLLLDYKLQDNPEFVKASKLAIEAYAHSIVRSDTELILAVDADARPVMATGEISLSASEKADLLRIVREGIAGWTDVRLAGADRIGNIFAFAPFEWHVLVLEETQAFYSETTQMTLQNASVLAAAVAASIVLLVVFSNYLTRPLSHMVTAMQKIIGRRDFSGRVAIEYPDEIGGLANQFNIMTSGLDEAYSQAKNFAFREAVARKGLVQREYETLTVLGNAAEFRDPVTGAHIIRVGNYSRMLAQRLGEDESSQNLIYYASPLHDIGKLGIPDDILLKKGRLTDEEFAVIKRHPQIAYDILKNAKSVYLQAGSEIALTHHERFDGNGYPNGLKGQHIPLFGRIVQLVDVFDALTSDRPYKEAWPLEKAFAYLTEEKGKQFDPRITELFNDGVEQVRRIFQTYKDARG